MGIPSKEGMKRVRRGLVRRDTSEPHKRSGRPRAIRRVDDMGTYPSDGEVTFVAANIVKRIRRDSTYGKIIVIGMVNKWDINQK